MVRLQLQIAGPAAPYCHPHSRGHHHRRGHGGGWHRPVVHLHSAPYRLHVPRPVYIAPAPLFQSVTAPALTMPVYRQRAAVLTTATLTVVTGVALAALGIAAANPILFSFGCVLSAFGAIAALSS